MAKDQAVYDALWWVSFGGPECAEEVMPFLRHVVAGRGVPDERLKSVAKHYYQLGGASPINAINRQMIAALQAELQSNGINLPIYWGNRHAKPFLVESAVQMQADGVKRALAFVTSAYGSYSGCRQYREQMAQACEEAAPDLQVDKLRLFYNHPGFIETMQYRLNEALSTLSTKQSTRIVFTAHSIPLTMAQGCAYVSQLQDACRWVMAGIQSSRLWHLAYQSRSGSPRQPWLEPDINDLLRALKAEGVEQVVVLPIGFIADHMEVVWDLDHEAKATAQSLALDWLRVPTAGTHPRFIRMIRELIEERLGVREFQALGEAGNNPKQCTPGCCLPSVPKVS